MLFSNTTATENKHMRAFVCATELSFVLANAYSTSAYSQNEKTKYLRELVVTIRYLTVSGPECMLVVK